MDNTFEQFIDELKSKADLVQEIVKAGFSMQEQRRGKYQYGVHKKGGGPGDSLMVDVYRQTFTWWDKGGNYGKKGEAYGDVFDWLETYRKMEFWEAVKYLAAEYGVPMPREFDRPPSPEARAFREQVALFDVVAKWLGAQLASSTAAIDYAQGRGWTDETIRRARLGFAPGPTVEGKSIDELKNDLRGDLRMYGHDPECPAAVAILGLEGGRKRLEDWANNWEVDLSSHANWLEKGRIWGMLDFPRLVYPHIARGKVVYFSCRNLDWTPPNPPDDGGERKLKGKSGDYKTWNLPRALVGERRVYFNEAYFSKARRVVVCEGPADGVTWGQWDIPAVCLVGTGADEGLIKHLQKHETVFLGMDNGKVGQKAADRLGMEIGPECWVLRFPLDEAQGEDANDWLQAMIEVDAVAGREDLDGQRRMADELLANGDLFALRAARKAGKLKGPHGVKAVERAVELISQLEEGVLNQYHKRLREALNYGAREFNRLIGQKEKESKAKAEMLPTLGGAIGEWLVEYCYDVEDGKARLAYRDPDGKVGMADDVVIEGVKYIPYPPIDYVRRQVVLFPSKMSEEEQSTNELIKAVELFIHRYYLLDDNYLARIMAYYVLLTWIFDAFEALPYLRALGDYGSGKSELMRRVGHVCYRMTTAGGANTLATFFRVTEMFRGTVFIDEADLEDGGDMANGIIKFLNMGAMKGQFITRMVESMDWKGDRILVPEPFDPFCPKLIAMREDFKDKAVSSRSLTIHVVGKSTEELLEREVPLQIDDAFRAQSLALRNRLLRWRMDNWVPSMQMTNDLADTHLSARLNQVTMAVKSLAKLAQDEGLMAEITRFLRAYALEEVRERSLSIPAYIVEAIWDMWREPKLRDKFLQSTREGRMYFWMADVRERANRIVDALNQAGSVREGDSAGAEISPQGMGHYIREKLRLEVGKRQGSGVPVYWDEEKMVRLGKKYGVLELDYEVSEDPEVPEVAIPLELPLEGGNAPAV